MDSIVIFEFTLFFVMFYRIIAFSLVILGAVQIIANLSWPLELSQGLLERCAIGLSSVFLGLLNVVYVYETPNSPVPKTVLLTANILFIGFAVLLITTQADPIFGYIAIALSLVNCVMVLNHKV